MPTHWHHTFPNDLIISSSTNLPVRRTLPSTATSHLFINTCFYMPLMTPSANGRSPFHFYDHSTSPAILTHLLPPTNLIASASCVCSGHFMVWRGRNVDTLSIDLNASDTFRNVLDTSPLTTSAPLQLSNRGVLVHSQPDDGVWPMLSFERSEPLKTMTKPL